MPLNDSQKARFARHLSLPEIGAAGQERLLAGRVLVVGVGGLGSPVTLYLAAAGIGRIGLVDGDRVDISNLQRQIVHAEADIGRLKVESAADKLRAIRADVALDLHPRHLDAETGAELCAAYDVVIDATDTVAAKTAIADACHRAGRPYVYGGITAFTGRMMTVIPGRTACWRCVFGDPHAADNTATPPPRGPLGILPGVIGALQATEALKLIAGIGTLLTDALLTYSALDLSFRRIPVTRDPDCPGCGSHGCDHRRSSG